MWDLNSLIGIESTPLYPGRQCLHHCTSTEVLVLFKKKKKVICLKKKCSVLLAQLYPALCEPMDCSLPDSSVHGILQARILEWVAIPPSQGVFPTQGLNPGLLCCRHTLYHLRQRKLHPCPAKKAKDIVKYFINMGLHTRWDFLCI